MDAEDVAVVGRDEVVLHRISSINDYLWLCFVSCFGFVMVHYSVLIFTFFFSFLFFSICFLVV